MTDRTSASESSAQPPQPASASVTDGVPLPERSAPDSNEAQLDTDRVFDLVVNTLPQMVAFTDRDLVYRFVNRRYEQLFGKPPEHFIGKRLPEVIGPEAWEKAHSYVEAALAGEYVTYETTYQYAPDLVRHMRGQLLPQFDEAGEVQGYWAVLDDVTDYRNTEAALRRSQSRYRALFEQLDRGVVFYEPIDQASDFIFRQVNEAALQIMNAPADQMIDRRLSDVFPAAWQIGLPQLMRRVWLSGEPASLTTAHYKDAQHDLWVENSVVRLTDGQLCVIFRDVSQRVASEQALRESESRFRALHDATPLQSYTFEFDGQAFRLTHCNQAALEATNQSAASFIGQTVEQIWHDRPDIIKELTSTHETRENRRVELTYQRRFDGRAGDYVFTFAYVSPTIVMLQIEDITERKAHDRQTRDLMAELDHRVKNNLANVIALMDRTVETSSGLSDFRDRFSGRLMAMAATHELLASGHWHHVDLGAMVRRLLRPFIHDEQALHLDGEPIHLSNDLASPLGLVFHELATNAVKHGALRANAGRVSISWQQMAQTLELVWREQAAAQRESAGSDVLEELTSSGLGHQLIKGLVESQLGGDFCMRMADQGIVCHLRVPLTDDDK